jgi:tetratricopeptide (TPR) repeat protein
MWRTSTAVVAVLAILAVSRSAALYVQVDTRTVPVARLVANLEKELAAAPGDPDVHLKLARLFAMAYAQNVDELPASDRPGGAGEVVWFGHEPDLVPRRVVEPGTARGEASRRFLERSLEHYRAALEANPGSLLARLGYGWTLEQAGDRAGAIAEYRRVIERAWPKEQSARVAMPGERFYTEETARYLVPLLDARRDADEIRELQSRALRLRAVPRAITPIAIPLGDGLSARQIVDLDAQVPFDADGSGLSRRWTWIGDQAGWLVYDPAGKGQITSALQWFGNVTFWLFWNNGYEALSALDDNGDGELAGLELRHLAVWRDVNRNGISEPGEVRPLASHGIVAVSCRHVTHEQLEKQEKADGLLVAAQSAAGVRRRDGRTRPTYHVILRPSSSISGLAPGSPPIDPSGSRRSASGP